MSEPVEIIDRSRVDAYAAARRRAMVLHSMWRPVLAGAAGAGLVIGAVAIAQPRFATREVVVDRVVLKDLPVPNVVLHDVPINNPVPHDVPLEIPRIVAPERPLTADESRFAAKPGYQDAPYHGRVVMSRGGGALSFAGGKDFFPAHLDPATSAPVLDKERAFVSDAFIGDLAMCRQDASDRLWTCVAMHNGQETPIVHQQGRPT